MDLSEILLYLELRKKSGEALQKDELNMMLYHLEGYNQVVEFRNKMNELNIESPFKFRASSLIFFIEDHKECVKFKEKILQVTKGKRKYSQLFKQQIHLSKTKEQAINIIKEAKKYGVNLNEELWSGKYNSLYGIRENQKKWKKQIKLSDEYKKFPEIYQKFNRMKTKYFEVLSLEQLKQISQKQQLNVEKTDGTTYPSVFVRSLYVKEFARRVVKGICQLCEKKAPFLDKYGTPFLEVHHIHHLSKGGSDTIENVVALCPNCHRKIHYLESEEDIKKVSEKAQNNLRF